MQTPDNAHPSESEPEMPTVTAQNGTRVTGPLHAVERYLDYIENQTGSSVQFTDQSPEQLKNAGYHVATRIIDGTPLTIAIRKA